MARESCFSCGYKGDIFSSKVKLEEVGGHLYCEDCVDAAKKEFQLSVQQSQLTESQKLTGIYNYTRKTYEEAKQQTRALNTIKTIVVLIVVLSIIAALFQGCSTAFM